jgi:glutaredoxin
MTTVTVYTKRDCCLCDEAIEAIERVRRDHVFALEKVDIASDPSLLDRHGERIPVVLVDGEEAFLYRVDEEGLRRMVAQPAGATT